MRGLLVSLACAALVAACGGSDDTELPVATPTPDAPASPTEPATPSEPYQPEIALTPAAPNDDLAAQPGSVTSESSRPTTFCGYGVGNSRLIGTVSSVQDGDTLTVGGTSVRLDSIDAPELAQTYGAESRTALSGMVLGRNVTVTYAKKDRYGRIVGSVFTSDCNLVNLAQVRSGAAWYYEAYQCEINSAMRNEYAKAQNHAQDASLGLWAYPATAPWVYRNGVEPVVPSCSSANPTWVVSTPPTPTPTPSPGTSPTPSTCAPVWVNGYRRADGTYVRGHWRRRPGC